MTTEYVDGNGRAVRSADDWQDDPFGWLGVQGAVVRAYRPGARAVSVVSGIGDATPIPLEQTRIPGLFEGPAPTGAYRLHTRWPTGEDRTADPYAFAPVLGDLDLHLLSEGTHWNLAGRLGAVPMVHEGVAGTAFSVWAPNARAVAIIGDFASWDPRRLPMRRRAAAGVWELFVPGVGAGAAYKFAVTGADGVRRDKADPLARATELPPATASVVAALPDPAWTDSAWMATRGDRQHAGAPISIYEIHAASWKRPWDDRAAHDWDALADLLIPYVVDMRFTHVELMPIMEHPFGGSWGYQALSHFAPSARFGAPDGFARFVDRMHAAGIGVLLDWVPSHFPTDAHGFAMFDGTALYEHRDPQEGYHPDWNTLIFNLGRREVSGMLIASALWWLETFHVDGLRVDAVASMLYRDYSRRPGEWVPNIHGGRENLESIAFLRRLNAVVAERCPGAIMVAEESTAFPGVTTPVAAGGLGFHFKWNMGWMNDSLRYMEADWAERRGHHGMIGFGLSYAFSERFVLPLSHDEVVHGKRSLLGRMPGDRAQQFAGLRAYLGFMWTHPGKKLLFMGGELGQPAEWNHDRELDWPALADPAHAGIRALVRDLNALYRAEGALHHGDADPAGFEWIIGDDTANGVFAFLRRSAYGAPSLLCIVAMSPDRLRDYRIGVMPGRWRLLLDSDAGRYGGSGPAGEWVVTADPVPAHGRAASLTLTLPPLSLLILRYEGPID